MRVLLWSTTWWPNVGGVEVLGANLVQALVDRGHEVTVVSRRDADDVPATSRIAGAEVVRLPFRQAIEANDPAGVLELRAEVAALKRELRPEVVHLYHLGPDLLFQRMTRTAVAAPVVVTLHQPFRGELLADDVALGPTLREADAIAACSRAVLDDLLVRIPDVGRERARPRRPTGRALRRTGGPTEGVRPRAGRVRPAPPAPSRGPPRRGR